MKEIFKRLFSIKPSEKTGFIKPGLYHHMMEHDGRFERFHLRVEADGRGLLLADATAAVRLNPTGVLMILGIFAGDTEDAIATRVEKHFKGASRQTIIGDIRNLREIISRLSSRDAAFPVINLEDPAISPREARLMAPLSADIAPADPDDLNPILDKLWEAGIPHVTMRVGEKFDPPLLIGAVERAEDLGMIAGVRGRATDLVSGSLLQDLAMAGVDYVALTVASLDEAYHDALLGQGDLVKVKNVMEEVKKLEVCPVAIIPLLENNCDALEEIMQTLAEMEVRNLFFFALAAKDESPEDQSGEILKASELPQAAAVVEEAAVRMRVKYIWLPPVLRQPEIPITEQVIRGPRCLGDVSIRVEPDGAVIPPRGPHQSAGNLLTDSWEDIWNNEVFRRYRERVEAPTRCDTCPGLAICAADCPKDPRGWTG